LIELALEFGDLASVAARNALAAAMQAVEAAWGLTSDPSLVGEPPLEIVVALHIGTAIYGNIGAADRLDFIVIGPAVNLVGRIEALAEALNLPIVVSADFARAYGQPLHPLGRHELRGLATSCCFPLISGAGWCRKPGMCSRPRSRRRSNTRR
jgi:adenylate cyclase